MKLKYRNALARFIAAGAQAQSRTAHRVLRLREIQDAVQGGRESEARQLLDDAWRAYWGLVSEHSGWRCMESELNACEIAMSFMVLPVVTVDAAK